MARREGIAPGPTGQVPESPPNVDHAARGRLLRAVTVLVVTAVTILAALLLLGLLVVGRHGGGMIQGWDDTVEQWYVHHRSGLVGVSKAVAFLGDAAFLSVIAGALTVVLLFTIRSVRALVPIVAYLGGEGLVYITREFIHRHRPPTAVFPAAGAIRGIHETSYSFPSGHAVAVTAVLFAVLGTAALALRTWWPWVLALAASLFVVDTRLVLGVHWFSDVVFGLPLGAAWGVAVALTARTIEWSDVAGALRRPRTT